MLELMVMFAEIDRLWRKGVRHSFGLAWALPAYFCLLSFLGDGKFVRETIARLWGKGTVDKLMSTGARDIWAVLRPNAVGWDLYWLVGGVFLAIIYCVLEVVNYRAKRREDEKNEREKCDLIKRNEELQNQLNQERDAGKRLTAIVSRYDFFKVNLGLLLRWYMTYIWRDLKFGTEERMTLYRYDSEAKCLTCVDRHSDNLSYRQIGRDIPLLEDCILTRAFRIGVEYHGDMPNPLTACRRYKKRQKDLGCGSGWLQSFKMQPRTYFAWRITKDGNRDPVAVIMVESVREKFRDQNALLNAFEKHRDFIYMFINNFGAEMPSLPIAEKAGF